jgi:asparagine synthase (glutamine-hydrolysing)
MNPVSGLAACICRSKEDILTKILWQMIRRAPFGFHIYTQQVASTYSIEEHSAKVGACLRFLSEAPPIPLHGEIYAPENFDVHKLVRKLLNRRFEAAAEDLGSVDGAYSIVVAGEEEMILIRDHIGQKPLYYVQKPELIAAATEGNALELLGFEAEAAPKNAILYLSYGERRVYKIPEIRDEGMVDDLDEAAKHVLTLLRASVEARLKKAGRVALGFSGGLDSALLAKIASDLKGIKVFCLGLEGSRDLVWGAKAADLLGLDAEVCKVDAEDVEEACNRLLAYRSFNTLDLSIGVGVELLARRVREKGYQNLMLGQLADELFGGYMRYQRTLLSKGLEAAQNLMIEDVLLAERGLERDEYASAPYVDLSLPYASKPLVNYALNIHLRLKVDKERRKIVLRRVAEMLDLPEEIVEAPKKALQYSSGIAKVIKQQRNPYNRSRK